MADATAVAVSGLVIGQTMTAYQFFMPSLSEVRRSQDAPTAHDVYMGQLAAGALSIGVGGMVAQITGSKMPIYVAIFIALIIGGMYHYALMCRP